MISSRQVRADACLEWQDKLAVQLKCRTGNVEIKSSSYGKQMEHPTLARGSSATARFGLRLLWQCIHFTGCINKIGTKLGTHNQ